MKLPRLGFALSALFVASVVSAVPVDSTITAVTVYTDRAVVTRNGAAEIPAGQTELVFRDLPDSLGEQSVQFSATGSAPVTILDVSTTRAFLEHAANDRVRTAEASLEALHQEMRAITDAEALLESRRGMIERMEIALTAPGSKDMARPQIDALVEALSFISDQRTKLAADAGRLADQRTDLQRKLDAAEKQLTELRGPGRRAVKHVTVRVTAQSAGTLNGTLTYMVPNARWTPSYDVRVASGDTSATVGYFGVVRQNTGEDWQDVALTLSTARPSLGGAAPTLPAWELSEFRPRPMPVAARQPPRSIVGMALGAPAEKYAGEALVDAAFVDASVESGTTSASFKIETKSTIPSDGSTQKVPIAQLRMAAQPEYLTVPKRQETAFLTSKVTNDSEFPLLAGSMNVFVDGTFVATSGFSTVMPGEKFDLALGADESIGVEHKRVQRFVEQTGITNSGTRYTYEYLITIENNKRIPVRVVVCDQVPVSRHEEIVVKRIVPSERELKSDSEGLLKWTLDMKPGEKRELTVKFSIEHPNSLNVSGIE